LGKEVEHDRAGGRIVDRLLRHGSVDHLERDDPSEPAQAIRTSDLGLNPTGFDAEVGAEIEVYPEAPGADWNIIHLERSADLIVGVGRGSGEATKPEVEDAVCR
jgi:hypothetical protein